MTDTTETIEPMMLDDAEKKQLVAQARGARIDLVGPGGLFTGLTKQGPGNRAGRRADRAPGLRAW